MFDDFMIHFPEQMINNPEMQHEIDTISVNYND